MLGYARGMLSSRRPDLRPELSLERVQVCSSENPPLTAPVVDCFLQDPPSPATQDIVFKYTKVADSYMSRLHELEDVSKRLEETLILQLPVNLAVRPFPLFFSTRWSRRKL